MSLDGGADLKSLADYAIDIAGRANTFLRKAGNKGTSVATLPKLMNYLEK